MRDTEPPTVEEVRNDLFILALRHLHAAEVAVAPDEQERHLRNYEAISEARW